MTNEQKLEPMAKLAVEEALDAGRRYQSILEELPDGLTDLVDEYVSDKGDSATFRDFLEWAKMS